MRLDPSSIHSTRAIKEAALAAGATVVGVAPAAALAAAPAGHRPTDIIPG